MIKEFNAETIRNIFGSFDAETESEERFKDYFVTNHFFDSFMANYPLRIAVGNKGTGKSALLRYSMIKDEADVSRICIPMTAADLIDRAENLPEDPLRALNHWKYVFAAEVAEKVCGMHISNEIKSEAVKKFVDLDKYIGWLKKLDLRENKIESCRVKPKPVSEVIFYIDDLDKGWDGRRVGLLFVNSIVNACYDISKKATNIKFRLAIRWDLYDGISRINQDTDKIRQNVVFLNWTNHEIYILMANRISKYFGIDFNYKMYVGQKRNQEEIARVYDLIIDSRFSGYGKWDNTTTRHVLLAMIRSRPRDLITLFSLAANNAKAQTRTKITSDDLKAVFTTYSQDRLSDVISEYETRLHGLELVILSFKPTKTTSKTKESFSFTNDKISAHLQGVLKKYGAKIRFSYENVVPDYRRVLDFLYRIDFIQAWYKNEVGTIKRVNFNQRQLTISRETDFGYSWEVLPAYRWAIQPTKIIDVINSLEVEDELQ